MLNSCSILFLNYNQSTQASLIKLLSQGLKNTKIKKLLTSHLETIKSGGLVEDKKDLGFINESILNNLLTSYDIIINNITSEI